MRDGKKEGQIKNDRGRETERDGRGQMQRMMERRETHTVRHKKRGDRGTRGEIK